MTGIRFQADQVSGAPITLLPPTYWATVRGAETHQVHLLTSQRGQITGRQLSALVFEGWGGWGMGALQASANQPFSRASTPGAQHHSQTQPLQPDAPQPCPPLLPRPIHTQPLLPEAYPLARTVGWAGGEPLPRG